MAKAIDVAEYLIHLGRIEEDGPQLLTHLQLQKLLYYCQGWSLGIRKKPLFSERIEAWSHGPVVKAVWTVFKDCANRPIDQAGSTGGSLSDGERDLVAAVWNVYKKYSGWGLREMTHSEAPWKDVRGDLDPSAACNKEITKQSMQSYFGTLANS